MTKNYPLKRKETYIHVSCLNIYSLSSRIYPIFGTFYQILVYISPKKHVYATGILNSVFSTP